MVDCNVISIEMENPETWPAPLLRYLENSFDVFRGWETEPKSTGASQYDRAVYGLIEVLQPFFLKGWHCTRLTDHEIRCILSDGLSMPDGAMLRRRVDTLVAAGQIDERVAVRLKEENQADEDYRAGMIWFCFYPPGRAGESSIDRFFRRWGGEALYNTHEDDPITSPPLSRIGCPCIIEATVPIASLPPAGGLYTPIYRRFLSSRDFEIRESMDHEDRIKLPLGPEFINRILRYPDPEFIALTGCSEWHRALGPA